MTPAVSLPLLEVDGLCTSFDTVAGTVRSVDGVSWQLAAGETLGIVGESGCGKSVTALSIMRLVPTPPGRHAGAVRYRGTDLLHLPEKAMRGIRGDRISMIFQEPMTSLNPVLTVGRQIAETVTLHQKLSRRAAQARAIEMLRLVQIAEPERRVDEYPHQLSGGMRQRVMIALALACNPEVLIADEPTTALDVTIQAQILELLRDLQRRLGMAVVMITHDLGVVAESCDRVVVMYAGRKVEEASVLDLFDHPLHPYTRALMASMPSLNATAARLIEIPGMVPAPQESVRGCAFAPRCAYATERCRREEPALEAHRPDHEVACSEVERVVQSPPPAATMPLNDARSERRHAGTGVSRMTSAPGILAGIRAALDPTLDPPPSAPPLLEVRGLTKHYCAPRRWPRRAPPIVRAVDDVSFTLTSGETLALVGESGCGKTTTGKAVLRLIEPTAGSVRLEGEELLALPLGTMRERRRDMQIIFQDPYASLNPRLTAGEIVAEPLRNFKATGYRNAAERRERAAWLFAKVGLRAEALGRYPHEFSGGQRQRLGIARALALQPKLIVCDEPVSALDVSVQAQVINLLMDLQAEFGIAYLFVAHDLTVVRHISHRVAVMYLGHIVEVADRDTLFAASRHPYTEVLLSAVPVADPRRKPSRILLAGDPPSPVNPPSGCRFHTRCPLAQPVCSEQKPALKPREVRSAAASEHLVACHFR